MATAPPDLVAVARPCCLDFDLDELDDASVVGNSTARMNRLDSVKLRIRKKSSSELTSRKGPMIACHSVMSSPTSPHEHSEMTSKNDTTNCFCTLAPTVGTKSGDGNRPRRRSPSISRSRPTSPGSGSSRRAPSPGALDPALMEAVKNRVRRVQQARLYLLQQTGPNSFLIGGDSPEHKYRVVIGPQTCSCGRGPHCLHLLFVMLRVFQVPESDSRIYAKELKNYEVESLFYNYQERRNSRVNVVLEDRQNDGLHPQYRSSSHFTSQSESSSLGHEPSSDLNAKVEEEEICPICLLEMVDGESLVICATGCRNKLHHHCMAIWAEECFQQCEAVLCPLCRHPWVNEAAPSMDERGCRKAVSPMQRQTSANNMNYIDSPQLMKNILMQHLKKQQYKLLEKNRCFTSSNAVSASSKVPSSTASYIVQDIPPEQMIIATDWMKVFGEDLVICLYSRDWKIREMALRRLANEVAASYHSDIEDEQQRVQQCCAKILTMVAADPVYKVYHSCMRCFKVLLGCINCCTKQQLEELKNLVRPIIMIVLSKCADRNRQTAHLSAEVLVELANGQTGSKYVSSNSYSEDLDGLELILGCVLEDWSFDTVSWQWLAGRLIILDHFIQVFPDEFCLKYVALYPNDSGYKLLNYSRLITVVEFAFKALCSPHNTVAKLARHIFVVSASLTVKERGVFTQVLEMLSGLEPGLQTILRKRLHQASLDNGTQHQLLVQGIKKVKADHCVKSNKYSPPHEPQQEIPVSFDASHRSSIMKMHHSPTVAKPSKLLDAASQTHNLSGKHLSPPRPKDLPLHSSRGKIKKLIKLQQLPDIYPIQFSSSKRWTGSGSQLLSLFTNKKLEDLLPSKPDMSGIYREISQEKPLSQGADDSTTDVDHHLESGYSSLSGVWSEIKTPTSLSAPHNTPVQEVCGIPGYRKEFLDDLKEELIIPLSLNDLGNQTESDIPSLPGLSPLLELDAFAFHSHEKKLENENRSSTYKEGLDWKRGQLLGTGAFSSCYQARDVATGTLMAVKQMPFFRNTEEEQSLAEMGIREEIVTMSKLRHENIVRILGATKQGSHFNMFVEWMAGGSIAGILDRYGPFNEEVILRYTRQILEGLSYLHDNHILHRDLKGANLLVDSTGHHLRIGDFGTAARLVSQSTVPGEFQGQLLGTIAFMAPEVLRGEDYGRSCDVWSVGCCMIEMASTKPPWKENCMSNHLALMYKIASSKDPPSIPDTLSWMVKDLALQCLHINSELRPSAKQLLLHACFGVWQT